MDAVKRMPVVQQVEEQLKLFLFSGEIAPGQKLPPEKELCARLNIGRGSLREALRVLAATGYISLEPGKGAYAQRTEEIDPNSDAQLWFTMHRVEVQDYLEVRTACEPLAVRLAIERCTAQDVENLHAIHERFVEAVQTENKDEIVLQEGNFHNTIINLSQNQLLIDIFRFLNKQTTDFRYRSLNLPGGDSNAIKPHARILRAFDLRDPDYGEACMREHVMLAIQSFRVATENSNLEREEVCGKKKA